MQLKISFVIITLHLLAACTQNKNVETIKLYPGDDIQGALDRIDEGGTILLAPGVYKPAEKGEAFVIFTRKHNGITLRGDSENPEDVILNGEGKVLHVVFFDEGIDGRTVLSNMTITGGRAEPKNLLHGYKKDLLHREISLDHDFYHDGGGIMVYGSSPKIQNTIIRGNQAERCGGGISVFSDQEWSWWSIKRWQKFFGLSSSPLIVNNRIINNKAGRTGGGIDVYYFTKAKIVNNLIENNIAGKYGGAIQVLGKASAEIVGNSIIKNVAHKGGGALGVYPNARLVTVTNSIFYLNKGMDVIRDKGNRVRVNNSCLYNIDSSEGFIEGSGNVIDDPLFVNGPEGDYYLSQIAAGQPADSPCLNIGMNTEHDRFFYMLTTRTDSEKSDKFIDAGYHYPL